MPHRKSTTRKQPDSTVTLRRSPRFLTKDRLPEEYPKTPDFQSEKTHMRYPEVSKAVEELESWSNFSGKTETGLRRSAALNGDGCLRRSSRFFCDKSTTDQVDVKKSSGKSNRKGLRSGGNAEAGINQSKQIVAETKKRVARRSSRGTAHESVKQITKVELSVVEKANPNKHFGDKLEEKTKLISAGKKGEGNGLTRSAYTGSFDEEGFVDVERSKVCGNSCKMFGNKLEMRNACVSGASSEFIGEGKEGNIDRGMKVMGVKRKRNQVEEGHAMDNGWTKDQEMALQRAYFSAKPTPQIWKKVAKLVPGKSAKDCFNKLHSDHLTPPQPRTRMRSRKTNSPSFSLSTSTLLKPEEPITRRPSRRKHSHQLAQKTVRHLLQKHYNVDKNYEADLFSILEPTMNPSTHVLQQGLIHSTPSCEQKDSGYLKKCRERSSSAHNKKHISRLSGLYGATLASPPVLKQIKNKALHEKYIDQLHCREDKRRAAKVITCKENREGSNVNIQKMEVIKAAKAALVFDVKDAIRQFHHVKVSGMNNFSDFDDDFVESDDNEVEDES